MKAGESYLLPTKSDDLNLIPATHIVTPASCALTTLHVCVHTQT